MVTEKKELRSRLLKERLSISHEDWRKRSLRVVDALTQHRLVQSSDHIALYQSIRNEVDVFPLMQRLPDKSYYFPRTDLDQGTLEFLRFESTESFGLNRWGILEPLRGEPLSPVSSALIVVPGLAFDLKGHRLGYGKGFYDRFLSIHPLAAIGVCFSEFFLESLPAEAHDRLVSSVVTESSSQDVSPRGP